MPYRTNQDLPPAVRNNLPAHAQDIFRAAFNSAFASHKQEPDCEERAMRIAWAAVKHSFEKVGGEWVPKRG